MSWDVGIRHEVRGELVCESPVHVGGWEPSAVADLAVARDGLGRPVIPGTSIAGALRAWLATCGGGFSVTDLFGFVEKQQGKPSRFRVDDAPAIDEHATPQVRTGVAIDRNTRTAAAGFLYEREVLPAGTRFAFRLVADEPRAGDAAVAGAFAALIDALRGGHIPLGAARTRGLGRVRLDDAEIRSVNLADREGLRAWLTDQAGWQAATMPAPDQPSGRLVITVDWKPAGPVLVKDSVEGALVDMLPLTATDAAGRVRLLLPGSSVKGVLRSHAERIARTVAGTTAPAHLRETLDVEALPGVVGLFGRSPQRGMSSGWRGALDVADCHSLGHVAARDWNTVVNAQVTGDRPDHADRPDRPDRAAGRPEGEARPDRDAGRTQRQGAGVDRRTQRLALRRHLDDLAAGDNGLALRIADHVAVDRWTGGASDSALFSVLEPMGTTWEPLRLSLDCGRADARAAHGDQLALVVLLLVLRDLADGWLGFGYGTTRGHGHITVTGVHFHGEDLPAPWSALAAAGTLDALLADPPPDIQAALQIWAKEVTA